MPQCPVCLTRFAEGKHPQCPHCNWDGQPLSLMVGLIPEVAEKEAQRLQWAKQLWQTAQQRQAQWHQIQAQLQQLQKDYEQMQTEHQALVSQFHALVESTTLGDSTPATDTSPVATPTAPEPAIHSAEPLPSQPPIVTAIASPPELSPVESVATGNGISLPEPLPQPVEPPAAPAPLRQPDWVAVAPLPSLPVTPPRSRLHLTEPHPFEFETVTFLDQGVQRQKQTAISFLQPLGDAVHLEMIVLPAGEFWMGSPDTEAERERNEGPQHLVKLPSFCISRYPITQAQWCRVSSFPKIRRSLNLYPADFEGDDRPVEQVTWNDCIEFCARLSEYTGLAYHLPSEAEWEYACRAGTTTPFHFGETLLPDFANYDGNFTYGTGTPGIYRQQTTVIGTFSGANAFGLSDMHGNVWEWCLDSWHDTYQDAPQDGSAWEDEETLYRVLRGGAWYCLPGLCRSAQRHWSQPDGGGSGIGFRVVCAIAGVMQ